MMEIICHESLRVSHQAASALWTEDRRFTFLLKNVPVPLSADRYVWPMFTEQLDDVPVNVVVTDVGPDVEALQNRLGIAVPSDVSRLGPGWIRLGYDVCDRGLISGLLNCGYGPDWDVVALEDEWAPRLNERHLFDLPEDALAFAAITNRRVPEHSPFSIFGLYELRR